MKIRGPTRDTRRRCGAWGRHIARRTCPRRSRRRRASPRPSPPPPLTRHDRGRAAGPDDAATRPRSRRKADYVGKIPTANGTITLEITVEGDKAVAYACDGNTVESWLRGSAANGALSLANKDKTSRLEGRLEGDAIVGTLWIGEKKWDFKADPWRSRLPVCTSTTTQAFATAGSSTETVASPACSADPTGRRRPRRGCRSTGPPSSTDRDDCCDACGRA